MKTIVICISILLTSCANPEPSKLLCRGNVYVADLSKNEDLGEVIVECNNNQVYTIRPNKGSLNIKNVHQL